MFRRYFIIAVAALCVWLAHNTIAIAAEPSYVGTEGCKCHKIEVEEWQKSVHGKAFESLVAKKRSRSQKKALRDAGLDYKKDHSEDEKCVGCHTTGYGKPGGYKIGSDDENLMGVGCEMCHGAGSEYRVLHKEKEETFTKAEAAALGEVYPPNEEMCKKCHGHKDNPFTPEVDKDYEFKFDERIKEEKAWHKKYDLLYKH